MRDERTIKVHVHGLRNQTAEFEGGWAELEIGGMAPTSYIDEESVLFTVSGRDEKTGKVFDIEIAIPKSAMLEVIERLHDRADHIQ